MDHARTESFILRRWETLGIDRLLPEERDYLRLWWMTAEVNSGGYEQYFSNSAGDEAIEALAALEAVNATQSARALRLALSAFDRAGGYTSTRHTREERLATLESDPRLDQAFEAFLASDEPYGAATLKRAAAAHARHGLKPPANLSDPRADAAGALAQNQQRDAKPCPICGYELLEIGGDEPDICSNPQCASNDP